MNPNTNYGLWVTMCQWTFSDFNKCTTMVQGADSGGDCINAGVEGIWELYVPSSQFCCEPKTALKNKVYFLKIF